MDSRWIEYFKTIQTQGKVLKGQSIDTHIILKGGTSF